MIEELPLYISLLFLLTVVVTLIWISYASGSRVFLLLVIAWTGLQATLGIAGVYQDVEAMPPKIMLFGVLPTLLAMLITFLSPGCRAFIGGVNLKTLTYFHSIRIPVEIVLVLLFHQGVVSVYMTFEGTNFDIFSGLTAALVAYIAFKPHHTNTKLFFWWNVICLLLLLNVVVTAIFAIPSPFQALSLEQPNVAVLYFPYHLLPTVVVPLVLFAHLVALYRLAKEPH
ncbi:hypothetical protein MKJ04_20385 [Pontibacter sp. E15-1]|uniref:hypothetical protein n=1 Tax=Pontibacter sp. E15-1 TaxID=2919918 RepID=UPI001F503FF8|nr:hypothetical protein [Pontibacter sp. E15-1]MCJ8167210.1 hypothetical protein [Pontibacter sp. E15-1]